MNPEVKSAWLTALRSGNYVQTRFNLERIDSDGTSKFCCLGVLCDIAEKENIIDRRVYPDSYNCAVYGPSLPQFAFDLDFSSRTGTLPDEVSYWAKLDTKSENSLVELNDGQRLSFDEIADWIEVNI